MMFLRQIWTLILKNLLVALVRPSWTTVLRAFVLPVGFTIFISYARNLFIQPSTYGIGQAAPLLSLTDALDQVSGGRNKLVFVDNGFSAGEIGQVIDQVSRPAIATGHEVHVLANDSALRDTCRSSLRGVSSCIAAASFYSSPSQGPDGIWNYSIRTDASLGIRIDVNQNNNDQDVYLLPLQHSIDWAIARLSNSSSSSAAAANHSPLPDQVDNYPFTSLTEHQRQVRIRTRYMGAIISILAVAIFIGIVGVTYQLTGLVAMEREIGMSQLIDCMMPNAIRWQPQAARFAAAHLAFDMIYGPSWIVIALILKFGVYSKTSAAITIVFNLLTGLSLSSFSLFAASFFRKAQLSGITTVIACLLLGVVAQMASITTNAGVAILGLLFPPMNYIFFSVLMARWEKQNLSTDLLKPAPQNPWSVPGIAFFVFFVIQIVAYPFLAAFVERRLYGTVSKGRSTERLPASSALQLDGFTKVYQPNWFRRKLFTWSQQRQDVVAVDNLSLDVVQGEIMVLLGANGSGKSTTLDAISGLTKVTSGHIRLGFDERGVRLGLCPQKNVLWDSLTVREHVKIFNKLKTTTTAVESAQEEQQVIKLIADCDLLKKVKSRAKTLSGGQKRKLQLAMMFTGGSSICCVDEVSSGLDPISRRRIWDILLTERGTRTILLTTHFLDEAELLADHIAILAKGQLKAQGTSVELKNRLGSGYRIHVYNLPNSANLEDRVRIEGVKKEQRFDDTVYTVPTSADAAKVVSMLENEGIAEYRVSGPTVEDVFLNVAQEPELRPANDEGDEEDNIASTTADADADAAAASAPAVVDRGDEQPKLDEAKNSAAVYSTPRLLTGQRISMGRQSWVLFRKRATILRRNAIPYIAALLIPVIAAGLVTLYLQGTQRAGCSGVSTYSSFDVSGLSSLNQLDFVIGPSDKIGIADLSLFTSALPAGSSSTNLSNLQNHFHLVNSLPEFNSYVASNFANITPGGFYLGDSSSPPTFAWNGDNGLFPLAAITQNALDIFLTNLTIGFNFQYFDIPWQPNAGNTLQLITYFGLAMAVYPALFSLYPTVERLRNVRALHYSNGVRAFPLWLAYLTFDFCIVLGASVLIIAIFRGVSDIWYAPGYLFVVFFLYGLTSTLLAYVISLFARSQLAAFAFAAGGQCVMFLLYFIAYMSILTYAPTNKVNSYVDLAHFTISIVTPMGSLTRGLFTSLNVFSILCRGREVASYPGELTLYGGPILYLLLQAFALFGMLLWFDGGPSFAALWRRARRRATDGEEKVAAMDEDISNELTRVASSNDGLRVLHLTKTFGKKVVAVDDVTFGVRRGEVFALLGPNGAGKTTTITMIRGDMAPSLKDSEIFVENVSVLSHRAAARAHLGVCPQFDAMDQMTVLEHLEFYARIRGVPDVQHNVNEVVRAVGLTPFRHRMAMKLSGGNKRKLSLGVALMGNPTVLLLDEPSSGMDAASKRVMWRTLASVVPGRSIVLTTHSMEEADALASRAGIMARRMLALGTTESLRRRYGNLYYVHLVHDQAPHTSEDAMDRLRSWVVSTFPGASIEHSTYHGQLRFSVPIRENGGGEQDTSNVEASESGGSSSPNDDKAEPDEIQASVDKEGSVLVSEKHFRSVADGTANRSNHNIVGKLFSSLEENKTALGIQFYSVSQASLDQVFLAIVGQHDVEEENSA